MLERLTGSEVNKLTIANMQVEALRKQVTDAQATIADLQGQLEAMKRQHDVELWKNINTVEELVIKNHALQQRVAQLAEKVAHYDKWLAKGVYFTTEEYAERVKQREALEQRVAQLEGELAEAKQRLRTSAQLIIAEIGSVGPEDVEWCIGRLIEQWSQLQADHARVLGLVQALPVVGLPAEHTRPDDFMLLKTGEGWMAHTYNYWAKFATEEEARAYIALLEYRAALPAQPAQPAQGGACKHTGGALSENGKCLGCTDAEGETRA